MSLGDLDGDGDLDMAVANRISDDASVLLNNGDGTFSAAASYAAGNSPRSVSLGDLDGDGDLDMAVANVFSDDVSVLLNHGDGTFAPETPTTRGGAAERIAGRSGRGRRSGHGRRQRQQRRHERAAQPGDGTFAPEIRYAAGDSPRSVSLGDLDGDGDLEMVVANLNSDDASVLLNLGDGSFAPRPPTPRATSRQACRWAIWTGTASWTWPLRTGTATTRACCLGRRRDEFVPETRYGAGDGPRSVSLGDLDGDGVLDMAVANNQRRRERAARERRRDFRARARYDAGSGPWSVSLGDLDGDGDLDMAVANANSDDTSVLLNTGVTGLSRRRPPMTRATRRGACRWAIWTAMATWT